MAYSKVDNVEYAIDWIDTTAGNTLDITKYIISHTSEEGLTVDNNKISLSMKLIKDYTLSDGTPCPFFSNTQGKSRLKTDGLLNVYVRYTNGDVGLKSMSNLLKTYYITNWKVTEPDNKLTLDAVDLSYKITNRNLSKVYSYLYYETSGFTATGTTFTDSSKTFDLPATNAYQLGLKYMTLELIDTSGNIYNYLITNNTATTCTTHKTIASPVGAWSSYRIGWNSPLAIYDAIKRTVMPSNGQGEIYTKLETNLTTNVGASYINGIQVLRKDGATTWAFPIVNIGEPYIPVYKLINELSAYTACNTVEELEGTLMIKRDMTFAVNYNNSTGYTTANWFYADLPEVSSTTYTVSSVSDSDIVCDTSSANDLGKLARIKYTRGTIDYYKTYTIMAVNTGTNTYTLSSDVEADGITTNDTMKVIGSVDFVWDNDDDYKHIYSIDLGSKDEEKFNTVFYNAGRNEVAGRDVVGMYFYDETQSDSLKTTFVAMTTVAKNMMLWCTTGADGAINGKVIKKEGDDWLGWDAGASAFTSTATDWDFQTTFGTSTTYTITSRASFNSAFTTCAKIIAKNKSRAIVVNQKENTLTGTITTRGQKFVKIDDNGSSTTKWYEKGTRILFSKPDSGLANDGGKYYLLVVKKISHSITDGAWRTTMDVEYDNFNDNELINVKW
jgi:hypothetical protein